MRIAYLILVHDKPQQLKRLLSALPERAQVFVHVDARTPDAVYNAMRSGIAREKLVFVDRHRCRWGSYGIVTATLELIGALLRSGEAFDYATLLSGSDYPIKPASVIDDVLSRGQGFEFIECFRIDEPNNWMRFRGPLKAPQRTLCRHIRWRQHVVAIPGFRKLPYGLLPYGGSQWWTLSARALSFIQDYMERYPQLAAFFRTSYVPDEAIFQTILANSGRFRSHIANDSLRMIVWDRPAPPYPAILGRADMDLLAQSRCLFARKFAEDDQEVYDLIDDMLRNERRTGEHFNPTDAVR